MKDFQIIIEGKDETTSVSKVLKSLKIQDKEGVLCDTVALALIDKEEIALPETGKKIEILLNNIKMGSFVTNRVQASSTGTLSINASSVDYKKEMSTIRNHSWNNTTLFKVAKEIAHNYNLNPAVSEDAKEVKITEIQTESDSSFIARISSENGYLFKIESEHLVLIKKGDENNAKGTRFTEYKPNKLYSWTYQDTLGGEGFSGVETYYSNTETGDKVSVFVGTPSKIYLWGLTWKNEEEAKKRALAKLKEIKKPKTVLTVQGPFMPVVCGQPVVLERHREGLNGKWTAKEIEHHIDVNGIKTILKLGKE